MISWSRCCWRLHYISCAVGLLIASSVINNQNRREQTQNSKVGLPELLHCKLQFTHAINFIAAISIITQL